MGRGWYRSHPHSHGPDHRRGSAGSLAVVETWKLIGAYVGWLFAAAAIALLGGLLVGEALSLVGLVDAAGAKQKLVVESVAVVLFLVLAALPYLLRDRFLPEETGDRRG